MVFCLPVSRPRNGLVPEGRDGMRTALSGDDWRPGFAKRAPNFDAVCAQARAWRWQPGVSVARIAAAVLKGTPTLTVQQRMTLLLYVEHLNQDRLEQDVATVWPGTSLIADYLGCTESNARAHRRALEAAGFMVRDYTRANRPAGVEAYDLAPVVARLDEMEAADLAVREAAQARRAAYSEPVVFSDRNTARAPRFTHLEQSQLNTSSSVRGKDAPAARPPSDERRPTPAAHGEEPKSLGKPRGHGQASAICSPEGASGFSSAFSEGSAPAEMVRQELRAAFQVSPRIAALVGPAAVADPASVTPADLARVAAAVDDLLPERERNNDQTFAWALKRHGVRALAMLAIAIEDPDVRSPCKYFGRMASYEPKGAPDLRLNFARVLKAKGDIPPPEPPPLMAAPGADDPVWRKIDEPLRRLVREGAYGSWFSRVGFHGIDDGVLTLSTLSQIAADRIKRDYVDAILHAAEVADVFVDRVIVTLRKDRR